MSLFGFLFRKQRHVEEMLAAYLDRWLETLQHFEQAIDLYLTQGLDGQLSVLARQTHKAESGADDLRRSIEHEIYSRQLLPESRGDILGLLENLDRVPNRAETVLFMILSERIEPQPAYTPGLRDLVDRTLEATRTLHEMARRIFRKNPRLLSMLQSIDDKESECDGIARGLIEKIFSDSELSGFDKLHLRDMVLKISGLSDLTMDVADRLVIMNLKRGV